MLTKYKDAQGGYSVEEDSRGRLWLCVACRGAGGVHELHRLLTPGESRDFQRAGSIVRARARFILQDPRRHVDPAEEADYRKS